MSLLFNFMHFYCIFTEPSRRQSGNNGGDGNYPPCSVDGTLLGPNEEDIVHEQMGLVLTRANTETFVVTPFRDSTQTQFRHYRIVEGPNGRQYQPFDVDLSRWLSNIGNFAITYRVSTL